MIPPASVKVPTFAQTLGCTGIATLAATCITAPGCPCSTPLAATCITTPDAPAARLRLLQRPFYLDCPLSLFRLISFQ